MTNNIGATETDIFLFLTYRGDKWKNDAASIDSNDGIITQSEFGQYITQNWNENEMGCTTPENDIIRRFWENFDTNTEGFYAGSNKIKNKYAFDKNEIENMEKKLKLYKSLDEYIRKYIETPKILEGPFIAEWRANVKNELGDYVETYTGEVGKLQKELEGIAPEIKNRNTAKCYAEQALSTVQGLPKGYSPDNDTTLQGILDAYCEKIDEKTGDDDIKKAINGIIDKYLRYAWITQSDITGDDVNLTTYGFNPKQWNDLQRARVLGELKKWYTNAQTYNANKDIIDEYFGLYIQSLDSSTPFNTVMRDSVSDFRKSEPGKTLKAILDVMNIVNDSTIKTELTSIFGETGANAILDNLQGSDIINNLVQKIRDGEIDVNNGSFNLKDYLMKEITNNFSEISNGAVDDIPVKNLIEDFLKGKLWSPNINNANLEETKKLAIDCCSALVAKGGKVGLQVYNHFNINYKETINNYDNKDDLRDEMNELYRAIKNYNDDDNKLTKYNTNSNPNGDYCWHNYIGEGGTNWWTADSPRVVYSNETVDLRNGLYLGYIDGLVATLGAHIDYNYKFAGGGLTSNVGTISGNQFRPNGNKGKVAITAVAKIGDVLISESTMYITVKAAEGTSGTQGSGGTQNSDEDDIQKKLNNILDTFTISGTYSKFFNGSAEWSQIHGLMINYMSMVIDAYIVNKLLENTVDETIKEKINEKAKALKNYYNAIINTFDNSTIPGALNSEENTWSKETTKEIEYTDENGNKYTENVIYYVTARKSDCNISAEQDASKADCCGLAICRDRQNGDDDFYLGFNLEKILQTFKRISNL